MEHEEKKELTFEQALVQLETIVKKLELSQESLENSIALYEEGVRLKKFCEAQLKEAALKVEKINLDTSTGIGKEACTF